MHQDRIEAKITWSTISALYIFCCIQHSTATSRTHNTRDSLLLILVAPPVVSAFRCIVLRQESQRSAQAANGCDVMRRSRESVFLFGYGGFCQPCRELGNSIHGRSRTHPWVWCRRGVTVCGCVQGDRDTGELHVNLCVHP